MVIRRARVLWGLFTRIFREELPFSASTQIIAPHIELIKEIIGQINSCSPIPDTSVSNSGLDLSSKALLPRDTAKLIQQSPKLLYDYNATLKKMKLFLSRSIGKNITTDVSDETKRVHEIFEASIPLMLSKKHNKTISREIQQKVASLSISEEIKNKVVKNSVIVFNETRKNKVKTAFTKKKNETSKLLEKLLNKLIEFHQHNAVTETASNKLSALASLVLASMALIAAIIALAALGINIWTVSSIHDDNQKIIEVGYYADRPVFVNKLTGGDYGAHSLVSCPRKLEVFENTTDSGFVTRKNLHLANIGNGLGTLTITFISEDLRLYPSSGCSLQGDRCMLRYGVASMEDSTEVISFQIPGLVDDNGNTVPPSTFSYDVNVVCHQPSCELPNTLSETYFSCRYLAVNTSTRPVWYELESN